MSTPQDQPEQPEQPDQPNRTEPAGSSASSGAPPTARSRHPHGLGHLLVVLVALLVSGWAAWRLLGPSWPAVVIWLAGGVLGHDLVLLPLYSLIDRALRAALRHRTAQPRPVPVINHVRVPALLSGVLLLAWFPLILRLDPGPFEASSGLPVTGYLPRWLCVSGALFALSALSYGLRRYRAHRRRVQ